MTELGIARWTPFIAERYSANLWRMMAVSGALSALFTGSGLWLSYAFDISSGASVILVAAAGFWVSLLVDRLRRPTAGGANAS